MYNYFKLYAWMKHCFPDEFTIGDFRQMFESPQPAKILHDLTVLGFLERVKRGVYRSSNLDVLMKDIVERNRKDADAISEVGQKRYAFSHANAVKIYTGGKHDAGITKGYMPIHLTVLEDDLGWWENFFTSRDIEYVLEGKNKTMFGVIYILHPRKRFTIKKLHGMPVVSKDDVIKFCQRDKKFHKEALKYLKG